MKKCAIIGFIKSLIQTTGGARAKTKSYIFQEDDSDLADPWLISSIQAEYYLNQFTIHQSDIKCSLSGQLASKLFEKSRLSRTELCHVWELADIDKNGKLTVVEFMIAFHLIVARKNQFELPLNLPTRLLNSGRKSFKNLKL